MKNLLKIGVITALLLNFSGLYAKVVDFSVKVKNVNGKSVAFLIDGPQTIDLAIYGTNEEILYEQTIRSLGSSTRTYNLASFPDGNYTFKLVGELKEAEYKVLIEDGQAKVSDPVIAERFKPVLTREDELISLDLKNAPAGPIEVQVVGKYNEVLYSKVFESSSKLPKRFNVGGVYADELTFVIKSDKQESRDTVQLY